MLIRDIELRDLEAVVALNYAEESQTSPMNAEALRALMGFCSFSKVSVSDGKVVGFVLAIRNGIDYKNDNYTWFSANFGSFLYVDRVVVSINCKGQGIGSALYRDLFDFARSEKIDHVLCEYNLEPPNITSQLFHDRWGFTEVGIQRVSSSRKLVSLQAVHT